MVQAADLNTTVLRDEDSHHTEFLSTLQGMKLSHSMFGLHSFENAEEHGCQTPQTLRTHSRVRPNLQLQLF